MNNEPKKSGKAWKFIGAMLATPVVAGFITGYIQEQSILVGAVYAVLGFCVIGSLLWFAWPKNPN